MKKIFLNLGTIGLITAPVITLISCSDKAKTAKDDTQTGTPSTKDNTDLSLSQKKLELDNVSIPVKETLQEGAILSQSLTNQYDEAKNELDTLKTQGAASSDLSEINLIITNANAAKDRAIAYNTKVTEANNALAAIKRTTLNSIKLPPKTQLLDGATLPTDIVTYDTAQTNLREAQAVTGNDISALNDAIVKAEQAKRDATAYNAKVIDVNNNLASSKRTELTNISLPVKVALLDGATLPTNIVTYETAQTNLREAQAIRGNDISALNAAITQAKQAVTDAAAYNAKVTELNRAISLIDSKRGELLALSLPEKKVLLNPSSATTLTDITTYEQASAHLITAKEKSQSNDMNEIEAGITAAKAAIKEAKAYNTKVDAENNKVINAKKTELQAIVLESKVPLNSGVSIPANSGIVTYEQAAQTLASAKTKASLPSVSYQQLLDAIIAANQARTQAIAYNVKVNELNGDKAATLAAKKRQLADISLPPKVTLLGTLHLSISQTYEHAQQALNAAKAKTGDLDVINTAITNANAAIEEAKIYNAAALKANNDLITSKKAELNSKSLPVKANLLSGVNKPAGIISYEIAKTAFTAAKAKASLPSVSYQQLLDAISEANKAIADANTYNTKVTEANKKFIDSKKAELAAITLPAKVELITGATLPDNVVTYETAQTHLAEAKKVTSNDPTLLNAAITKAKQAKSDAVTYNTQATKVNNLLITSKRTELTQITLPTKVTLIDGATAPSGVTSYEESQTAFNRAKEKLTLASPTIEVLTKAISDAKKAIVDANAYNQKALEANGWLKLEGTTKTLISHQNIYSMIADGNGGFWVGGGYGKLDHIDANGNHINSSWRTKTLLTGLTIRSLVLDGHGGLWVGGSGGLLEHVDSNGEPIDGYVQKTLLGGAIINSIISDGNNGFWVGGDYGKLDHIDANGNFINSSWITKRILSGSNIYSMIADGNGGFLVGGGSGKLDHIDANGNPINSSWTTKKILSGNNIYSIISDGNGGFWVGGGSGKLDHIDANGNPINSSWTTKTLLDNKDITSIISDGHGGFFVGGNYWKLDHINQYGDFISSTWTTKKILVGSTIKFMVSSENGKFLIAGTGGRLIIILYNPTI